MILAATLPYFGGKRELAPKIVKHFGKHDTYYELFCGSAAVLFAKPQSRLEIASEKNPDVINLLRCLRDEKHAKQLWSVSELIAASETIFGEAVARLAEPIEDVYYCDPERAIDYLIVSWQGPSGLAGTTRKSRFAKRNTSSGGSTAARWRNVGESIPAWHDRLRNVEFRNQDAFEIIEDIPDREGVVVYADPPYYDETRRGGDYVFDFTPEQHGLLACSLSRFKYTQVVVSYYGHPELDELYSTFTRWDLDIARKMGNIVGGTAKVENAGEALYINRSGAE